MCLYVGEHVCRPSLLCNPVIDKIDNNNDSVIESGLVYEALHENRRVATTMHAELVSCSQTLAQGAYRLEII